MATNKAPMNNENQGDNRVIRITVQGQGNFNAVFRIKYNAPLFKLGKEFARVADISEYGIRLFYDGQRIGENDTAKSIGLEENAILEVYQEQLSG
ncbi:CBN-SMO-1 protein [Caenorhabditis brenneri]|uniref:Small ubiquitin-related modifier n=1 Tax=Caenorhabditis brenneri TaxID=135651 RepID=G0MXC4_CAEBE|nr:CBN-SMO-1 protein [Caenorhabditis brenneri]